MSVFHETYHVHTTFCDGANTVDEIARSAIEQGIQILGYSGHSFIPVVGEYGMNQDTEAAYIAAVSAAKEQYRGQLDILCGIEQDIRAKKPTYAYDYLIGSVHCVPTADGLKEVDHTADIQAATVRQYFGGDYYAYAKTYFAEIAEVRAKTNCTFIGHFDLVCKYNEGNRLFDESDKRYLDAGFAAIHTLCEQPNAVFELNTGALPRGARSTPYPLIPFLKEIKTCGGRIIFSADSHKCETLLFGGESMVAAATAAGFDSRVIILPDGSLKEIAI